MSDLFVMVPPGIEINHHGSDYLVEFTFNGTRYVRVCEDEPLQETVKEMALYRQSLIDAEWNRSKEAWLKILSPVARPVARVLAWFGGKGAA